MTVSRRPLTRTNHRARRPADPAPAAADQADNPARRILDQLAHCDDPLVRRWAAALLRGDEAGEPALKRSRSRRHGSQSHA